MDKLIVDPASFLAMLRRVRDNDDAFTFRSSGGLRIVIRNSGDLDDDDMTEDWLAFELGVVVNDDERAGVLKAMKNEFGDDLDGVIVFKEFEFDVADDENLMDAMKYLNRMDGWTVCPCSEHVIKDLEPACYYCQMTHRQGETENIFCPICHEEGRSRWMVTTACCNQKLHKKCKESCIISANLRNLESKCPMCREPW